METQHARHSEVTTVEYQLIQPTVLCTEQRSKLQQQSRARINDNKSFYLDFRLQQQSQVKHSTVEPFHLSEKLISQRVHY